jgi:Ni,Fe-hydrogenase III large subunit
MSVELAKEISEVLQGRPIGEVLAAMARVQVAILMQIPEPKDRLSAHRKMSAKMTRVIKSLSEAPAGSDIARMMLGKNVRATRAKKRT